MIQLAEKHIQFSTGFTKNKSNLLEVISPKTAISIAKDNEEHLKSCNNNGRVIKLFEGNCESLPFENNQFEVYISCLCLMMSDYHKSLKEAYRVLAPGGRMAIGIWGKREEEKAFFITEAVLERHGMKINVYKSYDMGKNPDALKALCEEIGFKNVQMDYTNIFRSSFDWDETEAFLQSYDMVVDKSLQEHCGNDAEKKEKIIQEIKDEIHQKLTVEKLMPSMNILIIIGSK